MALPEPLRAALPEYKVIALADTLPPNLDIRDRYNLDYHAFFARLVNNIREREVQTPILCHKEGDKYRVMDGWTRCLASMAAGKSTIPAMVYAEKPTALNELLTKALSNLMRKDMTEQEKAAVFVSLMAETGASQCEIARKYHLDKSDISRILKRYKALPPDLYALVGKTLPARAGTALASLPTHELMREYAQHIVSGRWCVEALEDNVRSFLSGGKAAKPRNATIKQSGLTVQHPNTMSKAELAEKLMEIAKKLRKEE